MKERVKFILEWERRWNEGEGLVNMTALCREFGVSRQCGYRWVNRYVDANRDLRALDERSRRPHHCPRALDQHRKDVLVRARKKRPCYGPSKLRQWLLTCTTTAVRRHRGQPTNLPPTPSSPGH